MRVASYDNYWKVGHFDLVSGALTPDAEPTLGGDTPDRLQAPPQGVYAQLDDCALVFFRKLDNLYVSVAGKTYPADDRLVVEWKLVHPGAFDSSSNLVRRAQSEVIFWHPDVGTSHLTYASGPAQAPPLWADPTPFVSDEDWDLGLMIRNTLADDTRRANIFREGTVQGPATANLHPRGGVDSSRHSRTGLNDDYIKDVERAMGPEVSFSSEVLRSGAVSLRIYDSERYIEVEGNAARDMWGASVNENTPFTGHPYVANTFLEVLEMARPEWDRSSTRPDPLPDLE